MSVGCLPNRPDVCTIFHLVDQLPMQKVISSTWTLKTYPRRPQCTDSGHSAPLSTPQCRKAPPSTYDHLFKPSLFIEWNRHHVNVESHPDPNVSMASFFRAWELLPLSFMTEMEDSPICSSLSFSQPSELLYYDISDMKKDRLLTGLVHLVHSLAEYLWRECFITP